MKKMATVFSLALIWAISLPVWAEEPPHMEFVRVLRERNHGDLALEYLDRLAKTGPADIQASIPLEKARVWSDMANGEFNSAKKQELYTKARTAFATFVTARINDPLAAEARYEAARILGLQGRAVFTRAIRSNEEGVTAAEVQKALETFVQAAKDLKAADAALAEAVTKPLPPKVLDSLTKTKLKSAMEVDLNMLDQAGCYEVLNLNLEKRGVLQKEAITDLKKMANLDLKNPTCWMAQAYAAKGYLDGGQSKEAEAEFKKVLDADGPQTDMAKRMSRFFIIEDYRRTQRDAGLIQKAGEDWLRMYPSYTRTPEGIFIRFETAQAMVRQGKAINKAANGQLDAKAKEFFEKALALYTSLDEVETEYSAEIGREKLNITLAILPNVDGGDPTKVDTFDKAKLAATALAARLDSAKTDDERKKTFKQIQDMLVRASELASDKTPPNDVAEVRGNLAYVYMQMGDPYRAAILGDYVAHHYSQTSKAAAGGAFALQAYGELVNKGTAMADDPKWIQADNDRMVKLALFMEKTWPNDVNTDAARHQVGTLLLRQKKSKEAADVLSRVSVGYKPAAALTDARWWWAVACQQMANEKDISEKEKNFYHDQTLKALEGIPEVGNDAPGDIAQMYVQSKVQLGQVLFEQKKFDKMEANALTLQKRLPTFTKLDAGYRKDSQTTVDALVFYSQYGRANAALAAGNLKEAREISDHVLPRVDAQLRAGKAVEADLAKKHEPLAIIIQGGSGNDEQKKTAEDLKERLDRQIRGNSRDAELLRALMIVALRVSILEENVARSQQLLKQLQGAAADSTAGAQIYVQLVAQIKKQIDELKTDPKKKELYEKANRSFMSFLNELGKDTKLTPDVIFFLANAYSTLDNHAEAGRLLARIPEPGTKPKGLSDAEDKAWDKSANLYKAALFMSLKELRLGKKYDEATTMLGKILKTDWGQKSTEIDKEKAALYEDQAKYGAAAVCWKDLMGKLQPRIEKDPKSKELYYDAYYNYIFCVFQYANAPQNAAKKQENIERAAKAIVKLETTQPNMGYEGMKKKYDDLMKANPVLKKEYDNAKAAAPAPAAAAAPAKKP